jgi:hypothetical protein
MLQGVAQHRLLVSRRYWIQTRMGVDGIFTGCERELD